MCGIWGMFPTDPKGFYLGDVSPIKQMMTITSLRGDDSTGIALVGDPAQKPRVWKGLGGPSYILNGDAWDKIEEFLTKKAKVTFGHGRSATKGAVSPKNAHPFTHGHVTLVHNGTITWGLDDHMKEAETEVDSHGLCVAIAKKGLAEALNDICGAYAVIVHDAKEQTVSIVRNDDRPLHRLVLSDRHLVMSEYSALQYLAARNSVNSTGKIEIYPKHIIFKYHIPTATWSTSNELKELHEKKWKPTTPTHVWGAGTPSGGQKSYSTSPSTYGTSGSTTTGTDTRQYDSYQTIELLCAKIEPCSQGNSWRYTFLDEEQNEYSAISSYCEKEKEAKLCVTRKHTCVTVKATGHTTRFVKYRDLEWYNEETLRYDPPRSAVLMGTVPATTNLVPINDPVQVLPPETEKMTHVMSYNGRRLKNEHWEAIIAKEDCSICQGPVLYGEAENTFVSADNTLICGDCLKAGKHYQFGYQQ